jgi:hypothetical protein
VVFFAAGDLLALVFLAVDLRAEEVDFLVAEELLLVEELLLAVAFLVAPADLDGADLDGADLDGADFWAVALPVIRRSKAARSSLVAIPSADS